MRRRLIGKTLRALALALAFPATVAAQTQDTLFTERPLFVAGDAVLAAGFIAAAVAAAPADKWFTRQLQDEARQANRLLSRGFTVGRHWGNPGTLIAGAGIYAYGTAIGNRRVQDLGLHSAGAVILANVITGGIKVVAGRARPHVDTANARDFQLFRGIRDDAYRAFPSGHATAAFAFASVVTAETSHWWPDARWPVGLLTYGTATVTAVSRIYNAQHWASDVLVGAAIGTVTGLKLFRYQHSHPDNTIDRKLLRAGLQSTAGRWSIFLMPARL
jgi:membrane-associated phospholipid phosphatase